LHGFAVSWNETVKERVKIEPFQWKRRLTPILLKCLSSEEDDEANDNNGGTASKRVKI